MNGASLVAAVRNAVIDRAILAMTTDGMSVDLRELRLQPIDERPAGRIAIGTEGQDGEVASIRRKPAAPARKYAR